MTIEPGHTYAFNKSFAVVAKVTEAVVYWMEDGKMNGRRRTPVWYFKKYAKLQRAEQSPAPFHNQNS